MEISFQLETRQLRKMAGIHLFNQFIVSLSPPALTHSVSTAFNYEYKFQPLGGGGGGGEGAATPAVQL